MIWMLLIPASLAQSDTPPVDAGVDLLTAVMTVGGPLGTLMTVLVVLWRMGLLSKPVDYAPQLAAIEQQHKDLDSKIDALSSQISREHATAGAERTRIERYADEARTAIQTLIAIHRGS